MGGKGGCAFLVSVYVYFCDLIQTQRAAGHKRPTVGNIVVFNPTYVCTCYTSIQCIPLTLPSPFCLSICPAFTSGTCRVMSPLIHRACPKKKTKKNKTRRTIKIKVLLRYTLSFCKRCCFRSVCDHAMLKIICVI